MKAYRLTAWPDASVTLQSIGYRRVLSDMSQRHMTIADLAARSGLSRADLRQFIGTLAGHGLLDEREVEDRRDSVFGTLFPFGGWLRRAR